MVSGHARAVGHGIAIARREVYGRFAVQGGTDADIVLAPGYARQKSDVAAVQLDRAGVRLAEVLNGALR